MGEMLKGILEFCVMALISKSQSYGYEITRNLNRLGFNGTAEGTVYAILLRLEKNGFVHVTKRRSELGPDRKFYTLSEEGKTHLYNSLRDWKKLVLSVDAVQKEYLNDTDI